MAGEFKQCLLVIFQFAGPDTVIKYLKPKMRACMKASIEQVEDTNISSFESDFYTALMAKDGSSAKTALGNLRKAYGEYGLPATKESSGKYEMLHFLLKLEEFIDSIPVEAEAAQ